MTTIDTRPDAAPPATGRQPDAAARESAVAAFFVGAAGWVTATDHKKIGRLYVGSGLVALLATSVLGLLLGLERADDSNALLDANALLQAFQVYRIALVLGALAPLGLGLAVAVTPLQLGSRSIAFPRLAMAGFYSWLGGVTLTMVALGRNGGPGGGTPQAVDMYLAGLGLATIGLTATAGCVVTSVLTSRAPGMTMRRVPLFAWSSLIGALGLLLMLPVVLAVVVLVFVDLRLGLGENGGNFGGSEGIGAWLSWPFSVPAAVVYSLPAIGVAAELMPVTFKARQPMRGVIFAGIALVGVTALSSVTQQTVHAVSFDSDQTFGAFVDDLLPFLVFAGLPVLGLLIVLALGGLTAKTGLAHGRPRLTAAFVLATLGVALVGLGLLANAVLAIADFELVGTSFEEGSTLLVVY
jgi:heme/copper-type cytochrome/quinol oxidase subunit 1